MLMGVTVLMRMSVPGLAFVMVMMSMVVPVLVSVFFFAVSVRVTVFMGVFAVLMLMVALVAFLFHMHIEFRPGDVRALLARGMKVVAFQPELRQLMLELMKVHAHIEQRADEHVAADAAENIEVKSLHHNQVGWS